MDKEIKKKLEELDNQRATLLQAICEDEAIWQPQLIIQLVSEVRAITRIIKILRGDKGRFD